MTVRPPASVASRAFSAGTYSVRIPAFRAAMAMGSTPVDGAQLAFEAQLAEEGRRLARQTDKLLRRKNAEQDRQVIERAGLFRPGRGKVQRDAADRKAEAAVFDGSAHTLARLAHGGIRQADELKARQAAGDAALDHDGISADAGQAHGIHA